jgi:UDP-N-acetylmuramoyl-L-alanyl-D-glutamate--2,6-diaminopimelate ligase
MKQKILSLIGNQHPVLLFFYKIKAMIAVLINFNPAKKLKVIGVTGTDGKTTSVNLIANMLEQAGYKVGFTSTLRYKIGDQVWSNTDKLSTQSPFVLQKMLRKMVKEKCDYAVVEVTSHSVVQSRVWGINFDVAVFTNLSEDHIEYHGSFENYMRAKGLFVGSLFSSKRKKGIRKSIILNKDDAHFDYFDQFQGDLKFTYGIQSGGVRAEDILLSPKGSQFELKVPNASQLIKTNLIGEFNVYNVLAAICVGISQDIPLANLAAIFEKLDPISGRLESVDVGQDFSVVVDYAHTADALEKVCTVFKGMLSLDDVPEGGQKPRLILVFGATGGGRDKRKRPHMGACADKYADLIVLTNDDPYFENQIEIIDQIATGIKRAEGQNLYKIVDREEAIRFALNQARANDIVLITGKGGEEVIVIKDKKIPYDDREVVRRILSEKLYSKKNV